MEALGVCVYFKANFFVDPQDQTKWFLRYGVPYVLKIILVLCGLSVLAKP